MKLGKILIKVCQHQCYQQTAGAKKHTNARLQGTQECPSFFLCEHDNCHRKGKDVYKRQFQNRANTTTGPKDAPKPAHAKDTMPNTELLGSRARKMAMTEMTHTVIRAMVMAVFSEIFTLKKPRSRLWDTLEDAARS